MADPPQAWRDGFDEVAELYDKVRPGYPDGLFDELATEIAFDRSEATTVRAGR